MICNKVSAQHGTVIVIVSLTMPLIGKYANGPTNTKMWVITEITKQGRNESLEFPFPAIVYWLLVYCFCNQKWRTKAENM